jgi:hypothetical protein
MTPIFFPSGNGIDFGDSPYPGGVLAFSRILNDRELLVAANTGSSAVRVEVVVDANLNPDGKPWELLFSSRPQPAPPSAAKSRGSLRTVALSLAPMEAQVLG